MMRLLLSTGIAFFICSLFNCETQPLYQNSAPKATLEILNVGQGLSIIITHERKTWMVDAGGDSLVPWVQLLEERGIHRIEGIALSHWHWDHVSGVFDLMQAYPIDSIWISADPGNPWLKDSVTRVANRYQIPMRQLTPPEQLQWGSLTVQALWPIAHKNPYPEGNPWSLVLRIGLSGTGWALLPGDIGFAEELALMSYHNNLESDVLIVPHHGSAESSSLDFISKVNPYLALISVGSNPWNLPRIETIDRYSRVIQSSRAQNTLRTDMDSPIRLILYSQFGWIQE